MSKKTSITIEFDDEKVAKHFATWLCGAGEQDYWEWMRCQEQGEGGDITVIDFDYWNGKKSGKFLANKTIKTTAGRLDKE